MLEGSAARLENRIRSLCGLVLAGALAATASAQKALPQPEPGPKAIGTSYPLRLAPDLEQAFGNNGSFLWADLIAVHGASFVKAHLVDVNLRAGDVLVLKSASGRVVEEIRGRGPKDMGTFWALSAFGEELELEFRFSATYQKPPFRIDQVILGDPSMFEPARSPESVCSPENFDDVCCYQDDAGKWSNVMASVGVMSVGGTPRPVLKRLHDELMRAIAAPDTRQRLAAGALEPAPTTPEQFRKKIEGELQRWARVVKDAGIKQE